MKKFCFGILSLLICFFVCSCASVNYYFIVGQTGEINYGVEIVLDEEELNSKEAIYADQTKSNTLVVKEKILKIFKDEQTKYNQILSFGLTSNVNFLISVLSDYDNKKWNLKINFKFYTQEDYQVAVRILKAWRLSQGYAESENTSKTSVERNFFVIKKITSDKSVFAEDLKNNSFSSIFDSTFVSWANTNFTSIKDVEFTQVLATTDRSMHSNADSVQNKNGVYYHIWNLNSAEAKYGDIKTYYSYPNTSGWYITAFIALGIFFVWYCVYAIYKSPCKFKPKEKLANKNKNKK